MSIIDRVSRLEQAVSALLAQAQQMEVLIKTFSEATDNLVRHFDNELRIMREKVEAAERAAKGVSPLYDVGSFINGR